MGVRNLCLKFKLGKLVQQPHVGKGLRFKPCVSVTDAASTSSWERAELVIPTDDGGDGVCALAGS